MAKKSGLPAAELKPERGLSWAWVVPLAALMLAGWLGYWAWRQRGVEITVMLPEGHGLGAGAPVRYRGIDVGEVQETKLVDDLGGIRVRVRLYEGADRLARAGSRIWVVRPSLRLSGIEGVETLLGPRYLAVLPPPEEGDSAAAPRQREFVGLAEAPVVQTRDPGDLEIVLETPRRGSLRAGAPVTYRQVRIGTVLSVGLASDGGLVEAGVHIEKAYRPLVRQRTRFWDAGGVSAEVGLTGWSVEVDSVEALLAGGVAMATPGPDEAGADVHTGHRFALAEEAQREWLAWEPTVAIGNSLLPPGSVLPSPLRATIGWRQGFILKGAKSRRGWVLQTEKGLLGPADLLTLESASGESVSLEVAGRAVPLGEAPAWASRGLARLDVRVSDAVWPDARTRATTEPEDCVAVADPTAAPLPLAAARLSAEGGAWRVDPAVSVDAGWHGASVLSRRDGHLVGVLLVGDEAVSVALVTDLMTEPAAAP